MISVLEIIIAVAIALILSADGFMAIIARRLRYKKENERVSRQIAIKTLPFLEPVEELSHIRSRRLFRGYPGEVIARGGFTGRGNPLLARNKFALIENIDASIEKIVRGWVLWN